MGYQFIENLKNARDLVIREYEDTTPENLPDERYQVRLTYYDQEQLSNERKAYDKQYDAIQLEILRVWDVIEELYQKRRNKVLDYNDLASKLQKTINSKKTKLGIDVNDYSIAEKEWSEVNFIKPEDTDVQKLNSTYLYEKEDTRKRVMILKEKLQKTFQNQNPVERLAVE
jgi:hypothetical protein